MPRTIDTLRRWGHDLLGVIMPRVCLVCGCTLNHAERHLCLTCHTKMPRVGLHREAFSEIHQRLADRGMRIERAASYFYYSRHSAYAPLITCAKYDGLPNIAADLGAAFATEIMPDGFFDHIDLIVPVPLHRQKKRLRGYNQSEWIARGVSRVTSIPVAQCLGAARHSTQTRLSASDRWANVQGIYHVVNAAALQGRHVLVVDDVLTTGSTLLSCCRAIADAAPTARLSVLTLALARID